MRSHDYLELSELMPLMLHRCATSNGGWRGSVRLERITISFESRSMGETPEIASSSRRSTEASGFEMTLAHSF